MGIIIKYNVRDPQLYTYLLRIYNVVEFTLLSFFIYSSLTPRKYLFIIKLLPIFYFIFCFYDFWVSPKNSIAFRPVVVECIVMLLIITYLFYDKIQSNFLIPLYQTRIFWIAVALLIYFAGNFFLFSYSSTIDRRNKEFLKQFNVMYIIIFSTIVILKNLFICISLLMKENIVTGKASLSSLNDYDFKGNNPNAI